MSRVYVEPVPGMTGLPLACGPMRFAQVRRLTLDGDRLEVEEVPASALDAAALEPLTASRPAPFDRVGFMAVLNVTPDSFSDGGRFVSHEAAIDEGLRLIEAGADILDVGGESTRPGAEPVPLDEELRRVLPVVEGLATGEVKVSIDTRKATVMREAAAAGAAILNDVSALTHDPEALAAAAELRLPVILMHSRETPATMNLAPVYRHAALEVYDELEARVFACEAAGIARERIILDPGLCFAKHEPHNLDILRHLALFHGLGCPLLLGASRKGWTERLHERWRPRDRLAGSLAACQWGLERGVQLYRVHDVDQHRQLLEAWQALKGF